MPAPAAGAGQDLRSLAGGLAALAARVDRRLPELLPAPVSA